MKLILVVSAAAYLVLGPTTERHYELGEVLRSAAAYVVHFQNQLSGIVAEERYVQRVVGRLPGQMSRPIFSKRTLRSDLLLVRAEGLDRWVQFRDVYEVDGKAVRAREERLTALFLHAVPNGVEQARRIAAEGARYNLGDVIRTINVPVFPLTILDPKHQPRFTFSREETDTRRSPDINVPDSPLFRVRTEVWTLRFEEKLRPTLVRDPIRGRDVFSSGRFWIEPDTGRVLMSELISDHSQLRAQINVSYQSEPMLGLLVPVEMHEVYSTHGKPGLQESRRIIEAVASYGRFRRFQVRTKYDVGDVMR